MGKKKEDAAARVTFPLPGNSQTKALVKACEQQASTVLASTEIASHPEVAAAANGVKDQAKVVGDVLQEISNTDATLDGLRSKRSDGVLLLRLLHAKMESTVNVAAAGDKTKATSYGGKIVARNMISPSTDAPVDPVAAPKGGGEVEVKCKAEKGVICYLFQMGGDPVHPESWPQPAISGGHKHTFTGLTAGLKVYFRVAIVRTGSVYGNWSDILTVTVS